MSMDRCPICDQDYDTDKELEKHEQCTPTLDVSTLDWVIERLGGYSNSEMALGHLKRDITTVRLYNEGEIV